MNSISEPFQSGFKHCHSTETVLVNVLNDIFVSLDNDENILILLDLSLNENKTEVIVFGPRKHEVLQCLNTTSFTGFVKSVKNLGFVLDSVLKLDSQINNVLRTNHFHPVRILRKLLLPLSFHEWITVIPSVMELMLMNTYASTENPKRSSKNAKKYKSWLAVRLRIIYKIQTLVFKALHNVAPVCLSSMMAFYTPSRSLRSESQHLHCCRQNINIEVIELFLEQVLICGMPFLYGFDVSNLYPCSKLC
ncbi:Disease resistance protein RPS5 [Labeo rohita]|uniref:Disease resistance protein RPS5 n=1 Tax=Labeo rohita TaxID=84645 RepID=A0ABQ8L816_LABRO|nr:Disease resistance protein RPS5 [Labeo rohita]